MFYPGRNINEALVIGTKTQTFKVIEFGTNATTVNLSRTNSTIEVKFKELVDAVISQWKWHCYIHIISRLPPSWVMWAGPIEIEPEPDWYIDR